MKFIDSNANFMGFHFLEIVYTWFHLNKTLVFSFFINSLPCHQKIIYGSTFIKNETPIESSLRVVSILR
jgi:hypothetical protein